MKVFEVVGLKIEDYLQKKPHLSRKYIAQKAGISNAYLSMVMQGKRALTEDLTIKILRVLKIPTETIEELLKDLRLENNMPAVVEFYQEKIENERKVRFNNESSRALSSNIDLLNCFEDLLRLKKVHRSRLVDLYGKTVVDKLQLLVKNNTIIMEDDYYCVNEDAHFTFAPEDAIKLMKTSLEHELFEWKCGINQGITRMAICELSEDNYKGLLKLVRKQMEEVNDFIEANRFKEKSIKGGRRMNVIHAITGLKYFPVFIGLCFATLLSINPINGFANECECGIANTGDDQHQLIDANATSGGTGPNGTDTDMTSGGTGPDGTDPVRGPNMQVDQDGDQFQEQEQEQEQVQEESEDGWEQWEQIEQQFQDQFQS